MGMFVALLVALEALVGLLINPWPLGLLEGDLGQPEGLLDPTEGLLGSSEGLLGPSNNILGCFEGLSGLFLYRRPSVPSLGSPPGPL